MTEPLFLADAYAGEAASVVTGHTPEGGVIVDASIFYATSGGQPGDSGRLSWPGGSLEIATAVRGEAGAIVLVPAAPLALPPIGTTVTQVIDWGRRHRHMRVHTALHLLSVVIPRPVTGGAVAMGGGRLDFDMDEAPPTPQSIERALNDLADRDLPVSAEWITQADLDARPDLVKTLAVRPPRGAGRIRLVRIGQGAQTVDLQPCGGTHVARTSEIGRITVEKITNKGRQNRRVSIALES